MTFSGPYEGIQRPYGRIWAGGEKKSKLWLPTGVSCSSVCPLTEETVAGVWKHWTFLAPILYRYR